MLDRGLERRTEIESVGSGLSNPIVDLTRRQLMWKNLGWLAGRLGDIHFVRYAR